MEKPRKDTVTDRPFSPDRTVSEPADVADTAATDVATDAAAPPPLVEAPPWVEEAIAHAVTLLDAEPPVHPVSPGRREALMVLDGPLHMENAPYFRAVNEFLVRRLTRAVERIESAPTDNAIRVWKLYNQGFVVRTPTVAIGMDLVRGWQSPDEARHRHGLSPETTGRLLDRLDALTVSHRHDDHADASVLALALERGLPVLADPSVFPESPAHPCLVRPARLDPDEAAGGGAESGDADGVSNPVESVAPRFSTLTLPERGNRRAPGRIEWLAYPGHQGPGVVNNVHLFRTPEGFTFLHTGDQFHDADWPWIDRVGDFFEVDVLFVNCWTRDLARVVRGVRPRLVVTGHEVELRHSPDYRQAYWASFQRFIGLEAQPHLILAWGEEFAYPLSNTNGP